MWSNICDYLFNRYCAAPVECVLYGRTLNVDMEWLYGASESSNMEVDIGYLPQVRADNYVQRVQRVTETASIDILLHALKSVFLVADESNLKLLFYCHLGMIS